MATKATELDATLEAHADIEVIRSRSLDYPIHCVFYSGDTEYNFTFTGFTGAVMQVRTKADNPVVVLEFNTDDSSITLGSDGVLTLSKTATEMTVRAGTYEYDLKLTGDSTLPQRAFLGGKFIIKNNVTR